jgi:hypothetical protein
MAACQPFCAKGQEKIPAKKFGPAAGGMIFCFFQKPKGHFPGGRVA